MEKTIARELKRGTLELIILKLLENGQKYGYELVSELDQRSSGSFKIREGTLYPILYRLEDQGFIVPKWNQPDRGVPRKYYRLTQTGISQLKRLCEEWVSYSRFVNSVLCVEEDSK